MKRRIDSRGYMNVLIVALLGILLVVSYVYIVAPTDDNGSNSWDWLYDGDGDSDDDDGDYDNDFGGGDDDTPINKEYLNVKVVLGQDYEETTYNERIVEVFYKDSNTTEWDELWVGAEYDGLVMIKLYDGDILVDSVSIPIEVYYNYEEAGQVYPNITYSENPVYASLELGDYNTFDDWTLETLLYVNSNLVDTYTIENGNVVS